MPRFRFRRSLRTDQEICIRTSKCEPDSQWRILIPQTLRDYAGLDGDVVITGNGPKAKIWSKARWEEKEAKELNPANVASMMAALGI